MGSAVAAADTAVAVGNRFSIVPAAAVLLGIAVEVQLVAVLDVVAAPVRSFLPQSYNHVLL